MLFLPNELAKKAEITILPARDTTRPGSQAGALWVAYQGYIRGSLARDSHLGLWTSPVQGSVYFLFLVFQIILRLVVG